MNLLIPFFSAGYPSAESIGELIGACSEAGADYIELGLPHSDALADGPVIQQSSQQALAQGMNIELLCQRVSDAHRHWASQRSWPRLVLFSYYNPLYTYGLGRALASWRRAGGHSVLVPDLPVEEAQILDRAAREADLKPIYLVAPTTTAERLAQIVELSDEFIYVVSVTGVTGSGQQFSPALSALVSAIKQQKPSLPVVIGFGINSAATAQQAMSTGADGVVVGSAVIKQIEIALNTGEPYAQQVTEFLADLKQSVNE